MSQGSAHFYIAIHLNECRSFDRRKNHLIVFASSSRILDPITDHLCGTLSPQTWDIP